MKSILIILVISYILLCLLLFLFQRSFLYFPQSAGEVTGIPEVSFNHRGLKLSGWVVNPNNNAAIIYYGGNAESVENNIEFFRRVTPDYTVYLIPYRGYGKNGGEPTESNLYADALFVYDEVQAQHSSISLIGRSLGSGVATYVAANRDIAKLILVTPYDSIENVAKSHYRIFPVSLLITDKYLSVERAPDIEKPTLLLVAEHDQVIPRERSDNLARHISQKFLTQVIIDRAGHNDISFYPEYSESIQRFLE
ncbi:alpha/beta hydrolase [Aliikangiella coralliicola]|uniref:Lysophospholipase n=1 Tax=Aliikangiella coralliicola TaxID=2592383 RepID=A0A545UBY0_9GAMM|nr:alpha/beta hydrolase [Aliikangiella coralliicola]TQV86933.1 lysophospholipase [Aliikangiella coralliicola]